MRRWAIALAMVACTLAMAQPASATPQWFSPPQPFDDSVVEGSSAAMTADGTVAVARVIQGEGIDVRIRPPGGSFGPAGALTPSGGEAPRLVAGPNGYIAAVWRAGWSEYAAVRPPGGTFGASHPIGDASEEYADQVAVDDTGRVWVASNAYPAPVVTMGLDSTRTFELGAGSGWEFIEAALGVDAHGWVTVVYRQRRSTWGSNDGDSCSFESRIRVAEGDALGLRDVGSLAEATETGVYHLGSCTDVTGAGIGATSVAVNPSGEAVATYQLGTLGEGGSEQWQTVARVRPAGGAWPDAGTPAETVGATQASSTPAFAGDTPIVTLYDTNTHEIFLSARGPAGWSAPQAVAPGGGGPPWLTASPGGTAAIVYAANAQLMGVVRAADGTLSAPAPVSAPLGASASISGLAMDDAGNAIAVWNEGPWSTPHVVVAGYDGAGPQLSASLPAGRERGEPATFSAAALDVWSGVASVAWSFGDGTNAMGDTVSHAFETPGTFPVSVTAVDGLGNASARSETLAIGDTTTPTFTRRPWVTPKRLRRGHVAIVWFSVSEAATVHVQVLARRRGMRSGRRCVAPRRHRRRSARRCWRSVRVVSRSTRLDADNLDNLLLDTGRLRPGRYALVVGATDPYGNRAPSVTLTLTVLPRARR